MYMHKPSSSVVSPICKNTVLIQFTKLKNYGDIYRKTSQGPCGYLSFGCVNTIITYCNFNKVDILNNLKNILHFLVFISKFKYWHII